MNTRCMFQVILVNTNQEIRFVVYDSCSGVCNRISARIKRLHFKFHHKLNEEGLCRHQNFHTSGHRIDYTEARLLGFSYDFPMNLSQP
jgi:hypothetical protein